MKWFPTWIVMNGFFAGSAWYGMLTGNQVFLNIALVIAWFTIILTFGLFSSYFRIGVKRRFLDNKLTPPVVELVFDAHIVLLFASMGWIITAVGYAMHTLFLYATTTSVIKELEVTQKSECGSITGKN